MKLISPEDLSSVWGFIEPGLKAVLAITKEPWTPVHVKEHLRRGVATLFVDDNGFVILQKLNAPWTGDPYVLVWVMWFKPNTAYERLQELVTWLDEVTKQCKCDWWEWSSPRKGWRWFERLGVCKEVRTVWRRK